MGFNVGLPHMKLHRDGHVKGGKEHSGSLEKIVAEMMEERAGKDGDIDHRRSHLNTYTVPTELGEDYSADALIDYIEEQAAAYSERQRQDGKRGLRQDAVMAYTIIVKPPKDVVATWSEDEREKFLRDSDTVLDSIIGQSIASAYHRDEQAVHSHRLQSVMTRDGRWCGKEVYSKSTWDAINSEYPTMMRALGWDVDDVTDYSDETEEERQARKDTQGQSSAVYKSRKRAEERKAKALENVAEAQKRVQDLSALANRYTEIYENAETQAEEIVSDAQSEAERIAEDAEKTKRYADFYKESAYKEERAVAKRAESMSSELDEREACLKKREEKVEEREKDIDKLREKIREAEATRDAYRERQQQNLRMRNAVKILNRLFNEVVHKKNTLLDLLISYAVKLDNIHKDHDYVGALEEIGAQANWPVKKILDEKYPDEQIENAKHFEEIWPPSKHVPEFHIKSGERQASISTPKLGKRK